jgi:hypothetical protein
MAHGTFITAIPDWSSTPRTFSLRETPEGLKASTDFDVPTSDAAVIATVFPATDTTTPVPDFPDPLPTTMRSIDGWTRFTAWQVDADIHDTVHPFDAGLRSVRDEAVSAIGR